MKQPSDESSVKAKSRENDGFSHGSTEIKNNRKA